MLRRAAKLSLLNFLSFFRDLQKPTRFSRGGGSSRMFSVGGSSTVFPYLQLRNQMFTPHSVIFVGRETHFLKYDTNLHFFRKNNLAIKFPQFREISLTFRETWRSRAISGDSRKFRETWQVWLRNANGGCPIFWGKAL